MTDNGPWLPGGEHEQTDYSLRAALKISSNRAAAQLLQQVGYSQATYYAQRLGIESRLPAVASLALGTGGVTLLELTSAYGVFANQGVACQPASHRPRRRRARAARSWPRRRAGTRR